MKHTVLSKSSTKHRPFTAHKCNAANINIASSHSIEFNDHVFGFTIYDDAEATITHSWYKTKLQTSWTRNSDSILFRRAHLPFLAGEIPEARILPLTTI